MAGIERIIIAGGGIAGLEAALILSTFYPQKEIVLLEKSPHLGGLLRSYDYGEYGYFDHGAHNLQETKIPELDELLFGFFPEEEWEIKEGATRDIEGNYLYGKLNINTPYVDIQNLPAADYAECVRDFFVNLNHTDAWQKEEPVCAYDYTRHRFGEAITRTVVAPAIEKLFGLPLTEVHRLPLLFFPFRRVAMFNDDIIEDLTNSALLRARIGYTDQQKLPLERSSGKRIFYPKRGGMQRYVNALHQRLLENKVIVHCDAAIQEIHLENKKVKGVTARLSESRIETLPVEHLIWSAGVHGAAHLLNLTQPDEKLDPPLKSAFVHYLIDQPLDAADLYHFYCLDPGFLTYRVVDYIKYAPLSGRKGGYPVTLEMFLGEGAPTEPEQLIERGWQEMAQMNLLKPGTQRIFAKAEVTLQGFPMPSLQNMAILDRRRDALKDLALENMTLIGALSEPDMFFQMDLLADTYQKLCKLPVLK